MENTNFLEDLLGRIPHRQVIIVNSTSVQFTFFLAHVCNVIAIESPMFSINLLKGMGYEGDLAAGKVEYSSEMYGLSSLDSDQEWAA